MGIGAPAAGGGAAGGGGALGADLMAPALMMRVNSPGPELAAGAGAAGVCVEGGAAAGVADSRWINFVTLPASPPDGSEGAGANEGVAAGVNEGGGS